MMLCKAQAELPAGVNGRMTLEFPPEVDGSVWNLGVGKCRILDRANIASLMVLSP
jgi:hypothetical protein